MLINSTDELQLCQLVLRRGVALSSSFCKFLAGCAGEFGVLLEWSRLENFCRKTNGKMTYERHEVLYFR
jgi:hypothetical protein